MIMSKTTNKISLSLNFTTTFIYSMYSISYYYFLCISYHISSECLTIFTTHHIFHSSSLLSSEIQSVSLCNSYSDHESSHLSYTDTFQKISKHLCNWWVAFWCIDESKPGEYFCDHYLCKCLGKERSSLLYDCFRFLLRCLQCIHQRKHLSWRNCVIICELFSFLSSCFFIEVAPL